jgi:hypothetical protein
MKLNRSQKAILLKELGNLVAFQTLDDIDVTKFINLMKEKYVSWKDINEHDNEFYSNVNDIITVIQNIVQEYPIEDNKEETIDVKPFDTNVTITGSDVSTASDYLSSELAVFEDEQILIEKDLSKYNDDAFSFTGFSTDDFQQTNAISISPAEFWSDEESPSTDNDLFRN